MGVVLEWNVIIGFGAGVLVLFLLLTLLSAPLKIMWKLFLNVVAGAICLLVVNSIGAFFGFKIAINIITAFIVGCFGFPGALLLVILKIFLGV